MFFQCLCFLTFFSHVSVQEMEAWYCGSGECTWHKTLITIKHILLSPFVWIWFNQTCKFTPEKEVVCCLYVCLCVYLCLQFLRKKWKNNNNNNKIKATLTQRMRYMHVNILNTSCWIVLLLIIKTGLVHHLVAKCNKNNKLSYKPLLFEMKTDHYIWCAHVTLDEVWLDHNC